MFSRLSAKTITKLNFAHVDVRWISGVDAANMSSCFQLIGQTSIELWNVKNEIHFSLMKYIFVNLLELITYLITENRPENESGRKYKEIFFLKNIYYLFKSSTIQILISNQYRSSGLESLLFIFITVLRLAQGT